MTSLVDKGKSMGVINFHLMLHHILIKRLQQHKSVWNALHGLKLADGP